MSACDAVRVVDLVRVFLNEHLDSWDHDGVLLCAHCHYCFSFPDGDDFSRFGDALIAAYRRHLFSCPAAGAARDVFGVSFSTEVKS